MTHIIKARVENILGVKQIELNPNGNSLTIGGENGQGKTSAIWALVMALGGKAEVPVEPIRRGAEQGEVSIDLDKLRVRLTVKPGRKTELKVESLDGAKLANPQTFLSGLFRNLAFDPGTFKAMEPAKRLAVLQELLGLDFSGIERKRAATYEERTDIGRQVKELEGKAAGRVVHDVVPTEEVSSEAVMTELQEAHEVAAKKEALARDVERAEEKLAGMKDRQKVARVKIAEHRSAIAVLEKEIVDAEMQEAKGWEYIAGRAAERDAIAVPDIAAIKAKAATVEDTNRKVRANKETRDILARLKAAKKAQQEKTEQLDAIDREKEALIASKPMPIEGLSLTDAGVTYRGVPFEQLSESESWEVSTAIGFALNPQGIVFMRSAGGLDKRSRERVRARAKELGVQLFLEVVDDASDVQVLIEAGEVAEDRLAASVPEEAKA